MGEVYQARDLELQEDVALKTIRQDIGDPRALDRFKREIHLARQVTHPNACRIFDVFHHRTTAGSEVVFLTMELLAGETLAEHLERVGRLSPEQALPLVQQMTAALDAAHRANVIHRDFKSSNVLLVPEAQGGHRAVVTDFGLARRAASSEESVTVSTASANVVGTPAYMAPEQVEAGLITAATDIYSLGIVLYEMLTGHKPFAAETPAAAMIKRLREPPPSPKKFVPDLDPRWQSVLLRCLERDPADRFATAADVAAALAGEKVADFRGRRARMRRAWKVGIAAVVALVAGLAIWLFQGHPARQPAASETADLSPASVRPRRSVAVLGFKNLSGHSDTAWVSTALSEMLGSELAAGEALRTIAGETVARMKNELNLVEADSLAADTLARVRQHLGADLLIVGSYAVLSGRIRFDLRLQDAVVGETIAALTETGTEAELFELVSRAGARLRDKLGSAPLTREQAGAVRASLPSDPDAARLYAEGLAKLRAADALGARELLERAVAREPQHPLVHFALAATWGALGYDPRELEEARKAFELSEHLPRAERLAIEARYHEANSDWDRAIEIYSSLVQFFPDDLEHRLRLASALEAAGRGKEALASFDEMRKLPPPAADDPRIDLAEAVTARFLSENQLATEAARRAVGKAEALRSKVLLARAWFEEGSALQNLGELDAALAALERAREAFADSGERHGLAGSLNNIALIYLMRGDLKTGRRLSDEALAIYREIGNKNGEALIESNIGNIHYFEGDLAGAVDRWQQTLATYREINNREGIARMLSNIASATAEQGDVSGARRRFEQALLVWREIGNRSGEATTLSDIAKSLQHEGDLNRAKSTFEESLAIFRDIGAKDYAAAALHEYGHLLLVRGDLPAAQQRLREGLAMREAIQDKVGMAATRLELACLAIEQGRAIEAEQTARRIAQQAAQEEKTDQEAQAQVVLVRALLAQERWPEARAAADRAAALAAQSQSSLLRAKVGVVAARALAASGKPEDRQAAQTRLRTLTVEQGQSLPMELQLEARLILAQIELARDPEAGRAKLRALKAEAGEKGFKLLALQEQSI